MKWLGSTGKVDSWLYQKVFLTLVATLHSLLEPDGSIRTVKYTADKENGFQAQVYMNGKLVVHGNTGSGSDESDEGGYQVTHNILGSHSMEHPTVRGGESRSSNDVGRSSEEGFQSDEDFEDDDGDDDDDEDED